MSVWSPPHTTRPLPNKRFWNLPNLSYVSSCDNLSGPFEEMGANQTNRTHFLRLQILSKFRGSRGFRGSRRFQCEKRTTPFLNNPFPALRHLPLPDFFPCSEGLQNGGFQTVVRVWSGEQISAPHCNLEFASVLPRFYVFFTSFN